VAAVAMEGLLARGERGRGVGQVGGAAVTVLDPDQVGDRASALFTTA
jgi:hypothetical protein